MDPDYSRRVSLTPTKSRIRTPQSSPLRSPIHHSLRSPHSTPSKSPARDIYGDRFIGIRPSSGARARLDFSEIESPNSKQKNKTSRFRKLIVKYYFINRFFK